MDCSPLLRTAFLLGLSASASVSLSVRAASLSDLEAFTQSAGSAKRVFSDRTVQSNYRKTLQRYVPSTGPSAQDFEKVWEQLAKLRKQVGPVSERLLAQRKPMAIQYSGKPFYRFERVTPLHSVWLLESMREPEAACGARDSLLVDRWTPLLQDAAFFALERDGKFTGASVTMVPVRSGGSSYLLVSASDRSAPIPPKLLEAFLRDYRTREPRALPFALLTKENGAYRMNRVDSKGQKGGTLGPPEGFQLVDPTARKIVDAVPVRCAAKSIAMNSAPLSREVANMAQPSAPVTINVPAPAATNFNGASVPPAADVKPAAAPSAQDRKLQDLPAGGNAPTPLSSNGTGKPVVNSIVNNNQFSPTLPAGKGAGDPPPELVNFGGGNRNPASVGNAAPSAPFNGNRFAGVPPIVNAPTNVASAASGAGAQATPQQTNHYTPNDRRLMDAIQRGRSALEGGQSIPKGTIADIARGSLITQDPELKREAKRSMSELYFKGNPATAYQEIRAVQEKYPEEARNLIQQINSDLCTHCPDCNSCKKIRESALGVSK